MASNPIPNPAPAPDEEGNMEDVETVVAAEMDDDDDAVCVWVEVDCTQKTVLQAPCERNLPKGFRRMNAFHPVQPVKKVVVVGEWVVRRWVEREDVFRR